MIRICLGITLVFQFFTFKATCAHASDLFKYEIRGGAFKSYVREIFVISEAGEANYQTLSNFPSGFQPNLIGQFSTKLSETEMSEIKKSIEGWKWSKVKTGDENSEYKITVSHRGKDYEMSKNDLKDIHDFFFKWRQKVMNYPFKVLTLNCDERTDAVYTEIKCRYKNIGTESLQTIDPREMNSSFFCVNFNQRLIHLNSGMPADPRLMKPKIIEIKPGDEFAFSIPKNDECELQTIVKTTDMLINSAYTNLILGELHSNDLMPAKNNKAVK